MRTLVYGTIAGLPSIAMAEYRLESWATCLCILLLACSNHEADTLYVRASGVANGSDDAVEAVRQMAKLEGPAVDSLLLRIAYAETQVVSPPVRYEAIAAVAQRDAPGSALPLARLLVPHEPLAVRQAAANALFAMTCDLNCIEAVLDYLGRVASGEQNMEDRLSVLASAPARAAVRLQQQDLYDSLSRLLLAHPERTLTVLVQRYGLGSVIVSEFALSTVDQLRFSVACPQLLETQRAFGRMPDLPQPRGLVDAIASARC